MNIIYEIIKEKNYTISTSLLKLLKGLNLNVSEFIFIVYFDNLVNKEFNINNIVKQLAFTEEEVMTTLDSLMQKQLISLEIAKDSYNKNIEVISLDNIYALIADQYNASLKENDKATIYDVFEKEFNRKLTGMEYEIINAWLDNKYNEELIIGALKEAVYNGVNNFRYIDKILYEWHKKGFKAMNDVNTELAKRKESNSDKTLFDYNWLEESDE